MKKGVYVRRRESVLFRAFRIEEARIENVRIPNSSYFIILGAAVEKALKAARNKSEVHSLKSPLDQKNKKWKVTRRREFLARWKNGFLFLHISHPKSAKGSHARGARGLQLYAAGA